VAEHLYNISLIDICRTGRNKQSEQTHHPDTCYTSVHHFSSQSYGYWIQI
jgi:hypothetical protein